MPPNTFNHTAEEILSITNPAPVWAKIMLAESDELLGILEELNLAEERFVSRSLRLRVYDFILRSDCADLSSLEDTLGCSELRTSRALDWVFRCQAAILGQEDEDESRSLQLATEDG